MAEFNEENRVEGVFGGVEFQPVEQPNQENIVGPQVQAESVTGTVFTKVEAANLPVKQSVWSKIRTFLFQDVKWSAPIKIQLTPYKEKIEDEINEFLHQEISFKGFFDLVFDKNKKK